MKVCYVSTFYPPDVQTPDEMLEAWPLLRCLPPALADEGHDVVVLAHAARRATRRVGSVRYEFIDPGVLNRYAASLINVTKPRHGPAYYVPATRLVRQLYRERPDVVHFAGVTLDLHLAHVSRCCARLGIPLIVHFHGGLPDSGRMRRIQVRNAKRTSRSLFTTFEQSEPWVSAGLFKPESVIQVVETSSPYSAKDRLAARAETLMEGDPIYLSVGRLDEIKDPLTMLRGFELIAEVQRAARLYMYFQSGDLHPEITSFIASRPLLRELVELRGRASQDQMAAIYSSADVLLQASLREWSGLAVIEALSCGCIPVVTDIPSFRMLTADGRFGRLFPVGDAEEMARCALGLETRERHELSIACREYFEQHFSFSAMASQISGVYRDAMLDKPPKRRRQDHAYSRRG